jgi:hypothetical protein
MKIMVKERLKAILTRAVLRFFQLNDMPVQIGGFETTAVGQHISPGCRIPPRS